MQYCKNTWINLYSCHLVAYYTNQIIHFENTATSWVKKTHSTLKHCLQIFTEDLKNVVDKITLLLINQHVKHAVALDSAKMLVSIVLRMLLFQELWGWASLYALRKIAEQHSKTTVTVTVLLKCTEMFMTTLKLLCSHKIQKQLANENVLHSDDIHPHWHLEWAIASSLFIDSQLQVMNPLIIHLWGCSQGACRHNQVKNLMQWDLLAFEIVEKGVQRWQWGCGKHEECKEQCGEEQQDHRGQTQVTKQSQEISEGHFGVFHF